MSRKKLFVINHCKVGMKTIVPNLKVNESRSVGETDAKLVIELDVTSY
jgi:hypothetical protein